MTRAKFTPGPWIKRGGIVVAHRKHTAAGYNEESIYAATRDPNEREANLHLTASAPTMYAALEDILACESLEDAVDFAYKALSLARGER